MTFIGVAADRIAGRAIICSALDNLTKGASGQAVQNMNVMLGYPEMMGLEQIALFPITNVCATGMTRLLPGRLWRVQVYDALLSAPGHGVISKEHDHRADDSLRSCSRC